MENQRDSYRRRTDKIMHTNKLISGLVITLVLLACVCYGNDLDDGIPIDDQPMSDFDNVNRDVNITFIKMRAKSQAKVTAGEVNDGETIVSKDPTGSINSVISGPGSTFRGDVIIIDQSKGDKTVVVDE